MAAYETRSRGAHQALTLVVDVARDPRWGRVEETYGEDPYLNTRLGIAAVKGFQGDATFRDKTRVIATLKHFAAHGSPESGQNCAPVNVSERVLRETFLHPFRDVIKEAGAISVMASYNEIDGVPSHASSIWLLRKVLRQEWKFKGFVVSDYYSIWELAYRPDTHGHFVAKDKKEACRLAVEAGVNIELPEPDCYLHLAALVRQGGLREKAARRSESHRCSSGNSSSASSTILTSIRPWPIASWAATSTGKLALRAALSRPSPSLRTTAAIAPARSDEAQDHRGD